MFSSTFKRSVATLGVVTGLLAAAGPAGATPVAPHERMVGGDEADTLHARGTQVGSEGVKGHALIDYEGLTFD